MTTLEIERRLRLPAPDEPAILPALVLPITSPGLGAVRGRVGSGRTGRAIGFPSPRLVTAILLLLGALVGAIATGALRLDRLTNPFDPNAVFGGDGITIDYPKNWIRLTEPDPFDQSSANTVLVVSSAGVDGCASDEVEAYVEPTPYPSSSGNLVELPPIQDGTVVGLEDRILDCVIGRPMEAGETRIVVAGGMPQAIAVGPIGDFDADLFFGGDNPEFGFYAPTDEDGWTETIDGLPAKLVVSPTSVTPGADEVRTWIVFAPGGNPGPWYIQLTLRGPDLEALRPQADAIARSLRFDYHPPSLELATRDVALARILDAIDRETRLWRGSDLFGCFPRSPGAAEAVIDDLLHDYGPDGRLAAPVAVTCTTTVEPTSFETWYATLVVSWEAGDGYPTGEWGWFASFDANGIAASSQGQLVPAEDLLVPGTVGVLQPPVDGPFEIPLGSIVEVLPPGVPQTSGPIQAIYANPLPAIGDRLAYDAQPGYRYGVVAGPITHAGYEWYQVESQPGTSYPAEFVWIPSTDGTRPLVRIVQPACPGEPSILDLVLIKPFERLRCYGDRDITLQSAIAILAVDEGNLGAVEGTPAWLAKFTPWRLYGSDGPDGLDGALPIAIDPSLGESIPTGTLITVTGHFDDDTSTTCERAQPDELAYRESPELQQLRCRELFVVTSVE